MEADNREDFQGAIDNYIHACEYFNMACKYDKNPQSVATIQAKVRRGSWRRCQGNKGATGYGVESRLARLHAFPARSAASTSRVRRC